MRTQPLDAPWTLDHDDRFRVGAHLLTAEVRSTPGGIPGLWVEYEVDEEEWARNARRGFSITVGKGVVRADSSDLKPKISIAADSYWFDDAALEVARRQLALHFAASSSSLAQFAELPPPSAIVEFSSSVVGALGPNLFSSALWDGLKWLIRRQRQPETVARRTIIKLRVNRGSTRLWATIETVSEEHLKVALDGLADLLGRREDAFDYDEEESEWRPMA